MNDFDADFARRLQPGEQLLWTGRPKAGVRLQPADGLLIPFSFLWAGFACFWEWSVVGELNTNKGPPLFFVLWGLPFVLTGAYMTVGRFFFDAWKRSQTRYALTTERAVVVTTLLSRSERSAPLASATEISLREEKENRGTVVFGTLPPFASFAVAGWPGAASRMPAQFESITNARDVYNQAMQARSAAGQRR